MAKKISIGIDLGGTKIMAVVFDRNFEVMATSRVPTEGHRGSKAGLKRIWSTIESAMDSAGVTKDDVISCGIGCPGVVDFSEGVLREAANLGWSDVKIGKYLSKKIGKNVLLESILIKKKKGDLLLTFLVKLIHICRQEMQK